VPNSDNEKDSKTEIKDSDEVKKNQKTF